ncbi:hypothetical protein TrCOL_g3461 [Triparma columacea]|jgi:hypothetical protein|uniref:Uncharacterized protein n=1 Tax=Triparma columacea TaxID=722753 RepID=A0A9W7GGB5_9STRA|nr:hypothetical protein TrCOL_g3461 [Triparma columacea]
MMKALLLLGIILVAGRVSSHPAQFVDYNDTRLIGAATNFSSILNQHLEPYQTSIHETILSGQIQPANGYVVKMAVVIKEEMTFDETRKHHGWPAHQMHFVEMTKAGDWMPDHHWKLSKDIIPPKQMYMDPTSNDGVRSVHSYAVDVVDHLNSVRIPEIVSQLNLMGKDLSAEDYEQEVVEYMRADIQTLAIEDIALNMTALDDKIVELVDVIFVSICKYCENRQQKNVGVGVVGRNKDGEQKTLSVFSEVMYKLRKQMEDKDEEEDEDEDVDNQDSNNNSARCPRKTTMKGGSIFAVVFFVSGIVGVVSFMFGKRKGVINQHRNRVPTLDEFNESSTEMTGFGLDMRPMEDAAIVRADDIDGGDETAL